MTERLIFASHRAPVVLDGGASIRTLKLLLGLSEAFETTLVTFTFDLGSPAGSWSPEELTEHFPGVSVVAVSATFAGAGLSKRWSQLSSLGSKSSWSFGRYRVQPFHDAVHGSVRDVGAGIVHFNDLGVALSGPIPGAFNVYAAHNVEHRVHKGMAEVAHGTRKGFAKVEASRIRREELCVWKAMDLCLAVSELDAEPMRAAGAKDVGICLVGTDPVPRWPVAPRTASEPLRILFVGAGSYQPNEHGIAWFIENVFPHVRDAIPARLDVVGPPPNRPIQARGVTYRGYVPLLDDSYREADVVVVPIFFGSGTRGKVVEAMAYGRPVISTTIGAEGLQVAPGVHYVRADTAEEFIATLADLGSRLQSPDPALTTMLDAGRAAAERHFWPTIVGDLVSMYRAKLDPHLPDPHRDGQLLTGRPGATRTNARGT